MIHNISVDMGNYGRSLGEGWCSFLSEYTIEDSAKYKRIEYEDE